MTALSRGHFPTESERKEKVFEEDREMAMHTPSGGSADIDGPARSYSNHILIMSRLVTSTRAASLSSERKGGNGTLGLGYWLAGLRK